MPLSISLLTNIAFSLNTASDDLMVSSPTSATAVTSRTDHIAHQSSARRIINEIGLKDEEAKDGEAKGTSPAGPSSSPGVIHTEEILLGIRDSVHHERSELGCLVAHRCMVTRCSDPCIFSVPAQT
jgi:hypothetical protein